MKKNNNKQLKDKYKNIEIKKNNTKLSQTEMLLGILFFVSNWLKKNLSFIFDPFFFIFNSVFFFFSFLWKKISFSWLFRQLGRLGLYYFFKCATKAGVFLWLWATGATQTILAFPLFFYFILPPKFTKKYFGYTWGSGFFKILIGLTGWLIFMVGTFSVWNLPV